ncbi:MAG: GNAT family N-acetyltransferase [Chloroflexi bacterium]|nr:GNAT family N-acetyltransferase [Chloroflexota bacterium]
MSETGHNVELKTERLLLRPYAPDDVDDVFEHAGDPEWGRYLPVPHPYTEQDAEVFVAGQVAEVRTDRVAFAIELDGKVVGGIGLRIDISKQTAEIGYSLAKHLWGQGLISEAAREVVRWGFETQNVEKISAFADSRNKQSFRVMEKLGMTRERLVKKRGFIRGERVDNVFYGLLREDWEKQTPRHSKTDSE